jgi:radical SAM superfamily enzyme YgiQ (UPF0313 family)
MPYDLDEKCRDNTEPFELGPIRPPSEAASILIRLTRNCHWNRCVFCPVYKGKRYSKRKLGDIISDIDNIRLIAERIRSASTTTGHAGILNAAKSLAVNEYTDGHVRQVAFWMWHGMKSLFLQDADAMTHKSDDIVKILEHVRQRFPSIERITSYARSKTLCGKTPDELKSIRKAGLSRIHIGMESGSDRVLEMAEKGVTRTEQIKAGRNAIEAGFEVSEYYMPGLGGGDAWMENAVDSASALNEIKPTFVRIRSVIPVPGTPLFEKMQAGEWIYPTEKERVLEIKAFIERLDCADSYIASDHIMNLIEDAEGRVSEKDVLLNSINAFLKLSEDDQNCFIAGRRLGIFRKVSEYEARPDLMRFVEEAKSQGISVDHAVLNHLWRYI